MLPATVLKRQKAIRKQIGRKKTAIPSVRVFLNLICFTDDRL